MKQFGRWYPLLLKAQLKKVETWIAIVAMIAMVFIIHALKIPGGPNCEVAIQCENPNLAAEMLSRLQKQQSIFHFVLEDDLEQMKLNVINGTYECGFAIDEDYQEKLLKLDQNDIITYYCSSFTTRGEVAKETLYLALLEIESEIFLQVSADQIFENATKELLELLKAQQEYYLNSDELLSISSEVVGKGNIAPQMNAQKTTAPYNGTVALIIFLSIFLAMGDYLGKQKSGYPMYLVTGERFGFAFTKTLAAVTPVALIGYVLSLTVGEHTHNWFVMLLLMIAMILYGFLWCYGLGKILRKENRFMASLLAVILLAAVVTNAYIDLAEYIPAIKIVRYLMPPGLYLL